MSVLVVTGTDAGADTTVAAAALVSLAAAKKGHRVAAVRLAQTGVGPNASGDLAQVTRLSGVTDVHEFARYPGSLAPHHAAVASGRAELELADVVRRIVDLDAIRDTVVVEGNGGLLVPYTTTDRWTLVDLAAALRAPVVVVTRPGPDTINHTALTVGRLAEDGVQVAGIIVGRWSNSPTDSADLRTLFDLAALSPDGKLGGLLGDDMARLTTRDFRSHARRSLARGFGGSFAPVAMLEAAGTTLRSEQVE